jgi:hypothetical protein
MQWTVGEFTYAYLRLYRAARAKDYLVTHATTETFRLYLPPHPISVNLKCSEPVAIRVVVAHSTGLRPEEMSDVGFQAVAATILRDAMKELAVRCPRNANCLCTIEVAGKRQCGWLGRQEFTIDGLITTL